MPVPMSFLEFLFWLEGSPPLTAAVLLTLGVMLVNGWTDAPNAITSVVVTETLSFPRAVLLAAVCNFLGVFCVTAVNAAVAETIYGIADFGGDTRAALTALCAAMAAIVLWAGAAWLFGIPTSESHALIAGVSGAAVALGGGLSSLRWEAWVRVLLGLALSTAAGFFAGELCAALVRRLPAGDGMFRLLQLPGAALTAFFHGAQDGQKFLGIFLLGVALARGRQDGGTLAVPLWLMLLCAAAMALGTAMGGRRIIDTVGREMVDLNPRRGAAADLSGVLCLLAATAWGLPVSTTHTRTAALLGVSAAEGGRWDRRVAGEIAAAWLLTFPGCGVLGFVLAKAFLRLTG